MSRAQHVTPTLVGERLSIGEPLKDFVMRSDFWERFREMVDRQFTVSKAGQGAGGEE